jgi:hypothetical protein
VTGRLDVERVLDAHAANVDDRPQDLLARDGGVRILLA